ncbi:chloride channel protein [Flavobacterium pallidum]|uniref:Chloride channel protein n=1 Tax=Flavobacterium pallidum TaxID=2172098 RepID=A0A2S1SHZ7_9FLAO|nr:chloride channel protein [Flavobacterium pallidum]AWI26038.1 chloride channel protein [Flavobacterium pallidum]
MKHTSKLHFTILLLTAAAIIGLLSTLLALVLKNITFVYEVSFFLKAKEYPILFFLFPFVALSVIHWLREKVFMKKENKGITEIFETVSNKRNSLPAYKIPSHFINGFLTVIFGGSTGIEVSTVVATATVGSMARKKESRFRKYKTTLINCGIAAGITALFGNPLAGFFFCYEIISKKWNLLKLSAVLVALTVATLLINLVHDGPLFNIHLTGWHLHALPWFLLLGVIAACLSVYLTRCVLFFKATYSRLNSYYSKIVISSVILGSLLFVLPQLYGEGYHAITENMKHAQTLVLTPGLFMLFAAIVLLKPIATSATLASGGDGGVFAPSLFMGAFLGLLIALLHNTFFSAQVIPLNFMILGMGAMLSASIHAPLTAVFLTCGLIGDYTLLVPALLICFVAKFTAKSLYPFTVYTYQKA